VQVEEFGTTSTSFIQLKKIPNFLSFFFFHLYFVCICFELIFLV
jgi:hypothetical protein